MPELHILEDAQPEEKIRKLIAGVRIAKAEINQVQFELNMKITELQLKLQSTNPSVVREQCKAAINEGMATLDATVANFTTLFEQAMELVTNLQEDPN